MKLIQTKVQAKPTITYAKLVRGQVFYHQDIGICMKTDQSYSINLEDGGHRSLCKKDEVKLVNAEVHYEYV